MANGAQSAFSRKYAGIPKEPAHYAGAVRAYYSNVTGFHEDGFIELHFIKEYIPGYFGFPIAGWRCQCWFGIKDGFYFQKEIEFKKPAWKTLLKIIRLLVSDLRIRSGIKNCRLSTSAWF
ncbi:MAG: hypothetical protein R2769_04735 [Saprospiraceae bacterium]